MGGGGPLVGRPAVAMLVSCLGVLLALPVAVAPLVRGDDRQSSPLAGVDWDAMRVDLGPSIYRSARRVADRLVAVPLLAVALPLMGVIALAVRLDSAGPILFRQRRAGELARPFVMLKFRTMRPDTPTYSEKVSADDPGITRVGRLLRRTGLDELPQLWNVLWGDMGLIGPRPEQYQLVSEYEPWQHERHVIKPGLTGWWQVNHRDARPMRLNVEKDLFYVRNQGAALDAVIILRTIRIVLSGFARRAPSPPEQHDAFAATTDR